MKIRELLREIKGVFKPPNKVYYFGKIRYGTPYFHPRSFEPWIVNFRVLKYKDVEDYRQYVERFPHLSGSPQAAYGNYPMVRRNKNWIIKLFGKDIFVQIGFPISIKTIPLGWKWKYDSVRFEWKPSFQIYFFNWQFCIFWNAPDRDDDLYYEMVLWYIYGADKNIVKAEETWGWTDEETENSTWNKDYLI